MGEQTEHDDVRARAEAAVASMSLEERAALGGGRDFWSTKAVTGVPSIVMTDGPHGLRLQEGDADHLGISGSVPATCFPPAVGLAQSWDPDLAERVGAALADETREHGVSVLLGPGINIKRDPRCGRNFEYFSEDPLLTGVLGTSWVRGLQSGGVGASLKHFAANNAEHDRMRSSSDVDERPLHEIYLRGFERVVRDAQPATVMCSYNRLNDVLVSQNRWLLTDVLRGDWGFEGAVVSDWGAVADRVAAVAAGLDLQMPGATAEDDAAVVAAVRDGSLDEAAVIRAAEAVARVALRAEDERRAPELDPAARHALAREAAARSIVLLKNDDDLLPLAPTGSLAVVGEFAERPRYQGGGSSHVRVTELDVPLREIEAAAPEATVRFATGFSTEGSADAEALRTEAARVAGESDAAVVFLGLAPSQESEGFDRDDIEIPGAQLELLRAVVAAQPRTVVVVSAGGVLRLLPVHEVAPAILGGALLGQGGGHAIASVLFGAVNPSGRTAETVPLRLEDAPSFLDFPGEHSRVRYGEGIHVGYRGYDARRLEVLYPFGHGLSYTTFAYESLSLESDSDAVVATVALRNTGSRAGREVVQLYASTPDSAVSRAPRELVGFAVVDLQAGERTETRIRIERRDLAYWHDQLHRFVVEGGDVVITAGSSSRDLRLEERVRVDGDDAFLPFSLESTIGELLATPMGAAALGDALSQVLPIAEGGDDALGVDMAKMMESIPVGRALHSFGGGAMVEQVEQLVAQLNAAR